MRLLDLHHRQRGEGRGQQCRLAIVKSRHDQVEQQDSQQVSQGRHLPPIHLQVGNRLDPGRELLHVRELRDPICRVAHQGQRQRSIGIKAMPAVVRIERRAGRVEISAPLLAVRVDVGIGGAPRVGSRRRRGTQHVGRGPDRGDVVGHRGQEQLVGMLVFEQAPVAAGKTQIGRHRQHGQQQNVIDPGAFFFLHHLCVHVCAVISPRRKS